MRTVAKCETCDNPLEYRGMGRPPKFCDEGCFAEARRWRRRRVPSYIYDAESQDGRCRTLTLGRVEGAVRGCSQQGGQKAALSYRVGASSCRTI